jgi:hypothetical protein
MNTARPPATPPSEATLQLILHALWWTLTGAVLLPAHYFVLVDQSGTGRDAGLTGYLVAAGAMGGCIAGTLICSGIKGCGQSTPFVLIRWLAAGVATALGAVAVALAGESVDNALRPFGTHLPVVGVGAFVVAAPVAILAGLLTGVLSLAPMMFLRAWLCR